VERPGLAARREGDPEAVAVLRGEHDRRLVGHEVLEAELPGVGRRRRQGQERGGGEGDAGEAPWPASGVSRDLHLANLQPPRGPRGKI
jgi:hypothetical protein